MTHGAGGDSGRQIELIARGVAVSGGRVLLCRNIRHGYLYLPGGHVEFGEPARAALSREFTEEIGTGVRVGSCVLACETVFESGRRTHHEVNLVFHVELEAAASEPIRSLEAGIAFEWVELAAVVDLDVRPLSVKAWLAGGGLTRARGGVEWVSEVGASPTPPT